MSLSENERNELERLRKSYKRRKTLGDAGNRAFGLAFLVWGIPWVAQLFGISLLDSSFWRNSYYVSIPVGYVLGLLSSYYGPFKKKKEVKK